MKQKIIHNREISHNFVVQSKRKVVMPGHDQINFTGDD